MRDMTVKLISRLSSLAVLSLLLLVSACAFAPPVQEMSNARQSIQAAKDAEAQKYAADELKQAEDLMQQATRALDMGDYLEARDLAMRAQQHAVKAHQAAVSSKRK